MSHWVFFLVLLGALAHASWNTLIKRTNGRENGAADPFRSMILTGTAAGSLASVVLLFYGLPDQSSLIFMAYSVALQFPYYYFLSRAYETGEFSQVYPITRGTAALLAVLVSPLLTGDSLTASAWFGLTFVCTGVIALALAGGGRINRQALHYAMLAAISICSYTIFSALGVRRSGNPIGFAALHFVGEAVLMCSIGLIWRGRALFRDADWSWRGAPGGGALSFASYTIALWAMTVAPVALVSVLRETSVLMAVLLGVVVLKERLLPARIVAAAAVVSGLAIIRLG
jgi:drug/metabolite transporter (DMT)-like permease